MFLAGVDISKTAYFIKAQSVWQRVTKLIPYDDVTRFDGTVPTVCILLFFFFITQTMLKFTFYGNPEYGSVCTDLVLTSTVLSRNIAFTWQPQLASSLKMPVPVVGTVHRGPGGPSRTWVMWSRLPAGPYWRTWRTGPAGSWPAQLCGQSPSHLVPGHEQSANKSMDVSIKLPVPVLKKK